MCGGWKSCDFVVLFFLVDVTALVMVLISMHRSFVLWNGTFSDVFLPLTIRILLKNASFLFLLCAQVPDLQQRKCTIMFELSCNLERILEFFTQELPHAFLQGPEINLVRLCELIIFVLNRTTSSADALFFDRWEKVMLAW
jgi:hypothetical protein